MAGTGVVKGGVVVFENGLTLAEGTRVRVEELRAHATGSFWTAPTLDELAVAQGVQPVRSLDEVMGGWPEDELDDGFEQALRQWRVGDGSDRTAGFQPA